MRYPKGKGFDLAGGIVLTAVLDDGITITGTFLGELDENRPFHEYHENHGKPANIEVAVDPEFILLQLTADFPLVGTVIFPVGSIIAVNVNQILFIGPT